MISLSDYIKRELNRPWENEIIGYLLSIMTDDERKESTIHPVWRNDKSQHLGKIENDLYCGKGIAALKVTIPIMIEIKGGLLIDSFKRELQKGREYLNRNHGHQYWVIFGKNNINLPTENIDGVCFYSFEYIKGLSGEATVNSEYDNVISLKQVDVIQLAGNSLRNNNCTFILGAGVSVDAGSPTWDNLLKGLIAISPGLKPLTNTDYNNVNQKCGWSSLITARYILDNNVDTKTVIDSMRSLIYVQKENQYIVTPTALPVLAQITKDCRVESFITFNYDEFLEEALKKESVKCTPYYDKGAIIQGNLPIYHVHGLISRGPHNPSSYPVLSEREYHLLYANDFHWSNVEILHSLIRNTCFLVGLSMSDPNLRRLLDIARFDDSGDARHFVFLRKEPLDSKNPNPQKDKIHWAIMERKFFEIGLNIIWFDYNPSNPNDFTDLARKLSDVHKVYLAQQNEIRNL